MPAIDSTITLSVIIAIATIAVPCLTSLINNKHAKSMRKLELENDALLRSEEHTRNIYEGYLQAAGACVLSPTPENLSRLGAHSRLAMYYVSPDLGKQMLDLERLISDGKQSFAIEKLHDISSALYADQHPQKHPVYK